MKDLKGTVIICTDCWFSILRFKGSILVDLMVFGGPYISDAKGANNPRIAGKRCGHHVGSMLSKNDGNSNLYFSAGNLPC